MKKIHIVGRKNNGKTTLLEELTQELSTRGLKVGTIKHTGHVHEVDAEGKDSWRHRKAGGNPAGFVTAGGVGVFFERSEESSPYDLLEPVYQGCDIVLVEGDRDGEGLKIEVWRKENGDAPLAAEGIKVAALVTDDEISIDLPVWPRSNIKSIADRVLELANPKKDL